MKLLFSVVGLAVLVAGCGMTFVAPRYSISADNVKTLRTFKGQFVNVGAFSAANPGQAEIKCRGPAGPAIRTPDGETYEDFVRKAFIDELTIAEIYSSDAAITIAGRLDTIDFSSFDEGSWNIGLTLTSSNGQSLSVSEDHKYPSVFAGDIACDWTARALMPAVQNVIGRAVRHPNFPALLR